MSDYKLGTTLNGLTPVLRKTDGAVIPHDENNRDYQAYLAWVAEGNTADPAD